MFLLPDNQHGLKRVKIPHQRKNIYNILVILLIIQNSLFYNCDDQPIRFVKSFQCHSRLDRLKITCGFNIHLTRELELYTLCWNILRFFFSVGRYCVFRCMKPRIKSWIIHTGHRTSSPLFSDIIYLILKPLRGLPSYKWLFDINVQNQCTGNWLFIGMDLPSILIFQTCTAFSWIESVFPFTGSVHLHYFSSL